MDLTALILVLISCVLHAWWNLIYKRAGGSPFVMGWSKIAEVIVFLPVFLVVLYRFPVSLSALAPFAIAGALLTGANYVFLGRAYASGNLSVAYPVSRAGLLLFLPLLAFLLLGEKISWAGSLAVAVVLVGVLLLQLPSGDLRQIRRLGTGMRDPSTVFALLAALAAAGYTLWDRHAVRQFPAFLYFYGYTIFIAIGYALWLSQRRAETRIAWHKHKAAAVMIGVLNIVTYTLVLLALRDSNATYVIALRQLSIAIGTMFGWWLLREPASRPQQFGAVLLVLGCALVAFA
jgi:drug/metabolite transporter (DMT)-like permease